MKFTSLPFKSVPTPSFSFRAQMLKKYEGNMMKEALQREVRAVMRGVEHRIIQSLFAVQLWNCFTTGNGAVAKTSNTVEAWHTWFEATVEAVHPKIFKFLITKNVSGPTSEITSLFEG